MKTYVLEGFVLHGSGELKSIYDLKNEDNFVSPHDDLSQPSVIFSHHFNDDGNLTVGYYVIKVLRSKTLRDALMQVKIALCINCADAYLTPRYCVYDDNNLSGKSSCRYLKRPVSDYV